MEQRQFLLQQEDIPKHWYNIVADMGVPPAPPLYPATMQPCGPEALQPIFPDSIIEQEVSSTRWLPIPEEVLNMLALWRPTPLYRAIQLEQALGTPAKIFYKYEGTSPVASHKSNTSTVGLSNVSNGAPDALRPFLNRPYLLMLHKQGLYSAIVDSYDKELMALCKGEMPEILSLVTRMMNDQAVDMAGLSEKEKQYVKSVKVLQGQVLYSNAWLES